MSEIKTSLVGAPQGPITGENSATSAQTDTEGASQAAPAVETKQAVESTEKPQIDPQFASKFAALTRKEKAVREREAAIKAQQAELESLKKQLEEQSGKLKSDEGSLASRLKNEPLKVLSEMGLTFEDLSQIVLNEGNPTPEMLIKRTRQELEAATKSELEKTKQELEEFKKSLLEKEKQAEEAKVNEAKTQYLTELTEFINETKNDSGDDKYELIKSNDSVQLVYDVVEAYYEETGKILSMQEAADHVEAELEERAKSILELKKFKQASKPIEQVEEKKETAPTLSNALASQSSQKVERKLSKEESLREAAKLIRWDS